VGHVDWVVGRQGTSRADDCEYASMVAVQGGTCEQLSRQCYPARTTTLPQLVNLDKSMPASPGFGFCKSFMKITLAIQ
jgi:hypothetical protein